MTSPTKAYPAPKRRLWNVQVEFLDGTTIDAMGDDDAIERWRRIASWTDPTAISNPSEWMERVLARVREFYLAPLPGITGESTPTEILDALSDSGCLFIRRK